MTPTAELLSITTPLTVERESWAFDDEGNDILVVDQVPANPALTDPLSLIEYAGRWDYGPKSQAKMGDRDIIRRWLETGEESMVEMVDATFLITCSRVVSHELVRHRLASFQQESQRFVAYEEEPVEDLYYVPDELGPWAVQYRVAVESAFEEYRKLRKAGVPKQIARYVLPNATRTRIVVKANLREWRHILRLRLHTSAQPEMREVMRIVHAKLQEQFGKVLFPDDIAAERSAR